MAFTLVVFVDSIYPTNQETEKYFMKASNVYVMPIHFKNGSTACTPDGFALKQRCKRLKRELKQNADGLLKRIG